jgi:hypothetical protein
MDWLGSYHVGTRNTRTSMVRKRRGKYAFVTTEAAVFPTWSVPRLYNEVPRIPESSAESTRTEEYKMEHVLVICDVDRLAIAL